MFQEPFELAGKEEAVVGGSLTCYLLLFLLPGLLGGTEGLAV